MTCPFPHCCRPPKVKGGEREVDGVVSGMKVEERDRGVGDSN